MAKGAACPPPCLASTHTPTTTTTRERRVGGRGERVMVAVDSDRESRNYVSSFAETAVLASKTSQPSLTTGKPRYFSLAAHSLSLSQMTQEVTAKARDALRASLAEAKETAKSSHASATLRVYPRMEEERSTQILLLRLPCHPTIQPLTPRSNRKRGSTQPAREARAWFCSSMRKRSE